MLPRVTATRFGRDPGFGRTQPLVLHCDRQGEEEEVEVYVKLRGSPRIAPTGLLREAVGTLLGRDLGLPIPEPFAVEITEQFVRAMPSPGASHAALIANSVGWNFGSRARFPQVVQWSPAMVVPINLRPQLAEVFAFDAMIQNPDRGRRNPNCKVKDEELVIYDHELAFSFLDLIGRGKPPWEPGGLDHLTAPTADQHAFFEELRGTSVALERLVDAWAKIDAARVAAYFAALPPGWVPAGDAPQRITDYVAELQQHLPQTIEAIRQALR